MDFSMFANALRYIGALLLVIALILALVYILRRFATKTSQIPSGYEIKVLQRIALSPKQMLYVVEVLGRILLIGATSHEIRLIADLSANPGRTKEETEKEEKMEEFAETLKKKMSEEEMKKIVRERVLGKINELKKLTEL